VVTAVRKLLMVAYHFPPLSGSSGIQRTLRFVQHLPALGWQPLVLTAHPQAYERTSHDQMADVPEGTIVERAFALDAARHLSFKGRYLGALALPDRWMTWRFDAVRRGIELIRRHKPDAIWSTYPIATAHVIGSALHRRSGLPWVADFRDPMAQDGYPEDPAVWQAFRQIETDALRHAAALTFTTPSAVADYRQRDAGAAARVHLLENGYDEESFALAGQGAEDGRALNPGALTLLHSGIVYPSERDPTALLGAIRRLHDAGVVTPQRLRLRFRAAVAEDLLRRLAGEAGVEAYVEICPALPYREALAEMLRADALLVLQASNCNAQIPAKLYEYVRAGRPVLCFSDPAGDTAAALRASGIEAIARLDDAADSAALIQRFVGGDPTLRTTGTPGAVRAASRRGRAAELARILDAALPAPRAEPVRQPSTP
jgi:glycosyltransferase involved in cell wall biosynthesis